MEPRLPIGYAIFSSAAMFALAAVILGLEVSTKVDLESTSALGSNIYDITNAATVCSYFIALSVLTLVSSCSSSLRILQQISALHFIGIFLAFLLWIPRINGIKVISETAVVVPPFPLIINKLIVVFVFSILESILCAFTSVVALSKLHR